jgi:hypothetical protein
MEVARLYNLIVIKTQEELLILVIRKSMENSQSVVTYNGVLDISQGILQEYFRNTSGILQ